ncbi:MAG: hypothetical protein DRQ47_04155 [Gammaproteobacteria bacterium]|nr:MAG: hypothetical protein DRQ47_04155 [Gammaproteobacteria bacterium]
MVLSYNQSPFMGTLLGAAVGSALGHKSKHRTGATIAGAIVGASIGNSASGPVTETKTIENRCQLVPKSWEEEQIIGYNVVYRYNDRTFETRLPYDPGDSLKIRVMITPITETEYSSD